MTTSTAQHTLRVGTWNLGGRWSTGHADLLANAHCDVWLLTEVNERVTLPDATLHTSQALVAARRHWAGVLSVLPLAAAPDPHPASAMATVAGVTFCSSVLPWRSCGNDAPWFGERHSIKTASTLDVLLPHLKPAERLVWGGDWNHALSGPEYAGSIAGRTSIRAALDELHLQVPTAELPHRIDGLLAIDHLATGPGLVPRQPVRIVAEVDGKRLSDHDAYVVNIGFS